MKFTWASGNIGVAVERTAGSVHTTTIYIIPWELTIGAVGLLCLLIWALLRKRRETDSTTQS
jgi:hypothetical protein